MSTAAWTLCVTWRSSTWSSSSRISLRFDCSHAVRTPPNPLTFSFPPTSFGREKGLCSRVLSHIASRTAADDGVEPGGEAVGARDQGHQARGHSRGSRREGCAREGQGAFQPQMSTMTGKRVGSMSFCCCVEEEAGCRKGCLGVERRL
eukprot:3822913-Rhodomonas_salina.1